MLKIKSLIGMGVGPAKHSSNKKHGKSAKKGWGKKNKKNKKMVKKAFTIAVAILSVLKSICTAVGPEAEVYGYVIDILQGALAVAVLLF